MLGWAVLAQPRMPCGYSNAQVPTIPKEMSPRGKPHFSGATSNAKNVAMTTVRTAQSATLIKEEAYTI
jgi:hypothetical protein